MINENLLSNQFNYMPDHDQQFLNKVKRVSSKTKTKNEHNNPKGIRFQHRDEFGLMWEQTYQYASFATSAGDVMQANFFIKLQIKVGSLLQTQLRELSIPIEIL